MIRRLILPSSLADAAGREARVALPRECCGLLEGVIEDGIARVVGLHPTRNLATEADSFEVDPAVQFALMRSLRGTERAVVGCYHSHPAGSAEPSQRDHHGGGEKGFIWLIVAPRDGDDAIAAYVCEGTHFRPIEIAKDVG